MTRIMKKTIRIDNLEDVQVGDMLFVKGHSDGYRVACVQPVNVDNPFCHGFVYVNTDKFDHATRDVKKLKWPDPHDFSSHVYIGSDGKQYIYEPCSKQDSCFKDPEPWYVEIYGTYRCYSRKDMEAKYRDALPLTELKS